MERYLHTNLSVEQEVFNRKHEPSKVFSKINITKKFLLTFMALLLFSLSFQANAQNIEDMKGDFPFMTKNLPADDPGSNLIYSVRGDDLDYGDAPDTYKTLLASNGPRHLPSSDLYIGRGAADAEPDGYTSTDAKGDDNNGTDDEKADLYGYNTTLQAFPTLTTSTTIYRIPAFNARNTIGSDATLYAWIDFDNDGVFEADECATKIIPDGSVGQNQYNYAAFNLEWLNVPSGTVAGTTFMRFRITTDVLTDDPNTDIDERTLGYASNGEVEDHTIEIVDPISATPCSDAIIYQTVLFYDDQGAIEVVDTASGIASPLFTASGIWPSALGVTADASKFYYRTGQMNNDDSLVSFLMVFDGSNHIRVAETPYFNRLTIDADNNGYYTLGSSDATLLYTFDATNPTNITLLGTITDAPGNTISIAASDNSGDISATDDGTIFLLDGNGYLFTIDPATLKATYRGTVTGADYTTGIVMGKNNKFYLCGIYWGAANGYPLHYALIDTATTTWPAQNLGPGRDIIAGDLANCAKAHNPFAPPPTVPLSNWPIYLVIILISLFIVVSVRIKF